VIRFIDDVSREVDRQVLVYYIVPTFVFAIIIFSQFMGYASLYYKWLSYPGLSLEEVPPPALLLASSFLASSCFVVVFF
jgi:ABC-type microcin C transport system permease subunit YejB